MSNDEIYRNQENTPGKFEFNERVVRVFDDMITRSVPGYKEIADIQSRFIPKVWVENTKLYDLGCSTGNSLFTLFNYTQAEIPIVAIDSSEAMIKQLHLNLKKTPLPFAIDVKQNKVQDVEIKDASVVLLNFTFQFLPLEDRLSLLAKIYEGLVPGGVLLISEKVKISNESLNLIEREIHHDFKRAQGYSDEEIIHKRDAIENVLIPDTIQEHFDRFNEVGFSTVDILYKWFNFASFVCVKEPHAS